MSRGDSYDTVLKFLVIGDTGVGKTCVLLRYCEDTFTNVHLTTIGIDFKLKTTEIDGKKVKLQIWDTAGQERFKTITQNYYKGAMGIVLCYSVIERESFENISNWMKQINDHADQNVCKLLIANKADMEGRKVAYEEGQRLAQQYGISFFETSAKEGTNIKQAFDTIARDAYKKVQNDKKADDPINISIAHNRNSTTGQRKEGGGCC